MFHQPGEHLEIHSERDLELGQRWQPQKVRNHTPKFSFQHRLGEGGTKPCQNHAGHTIAQEPDETIHPLPSHTNVVRLILKLQDLKMSLEMVPQP